MQESNLNFEEMHGPAHPSGALQAYLRPEVEVQHVELEVDCLATASVAASGGSNPQVNDWGADSDPTNTGNSGDLSL